MSDHDDSVRTLFTGGTVLLVGMVLQLGVSFLAKLVVARGLTVADYGAISLGATTASLTATVVLLGLHQGIGRFLPRFDDPADRRGVLVTAFSIASPLAFLAGAAIVVAAPLLAARAFNSPEIAPVLRIFGLVVPLMVLFRMVISTIQGQQRSIPKVLIENVGKPFARILAVGVVLAVGISSVRIAWAYFVGWLVPVLFGLVYLYRETSLFSVSEPVRTRRRQMVLFSLPLLLSSAFGFVIEDLDTLLLGYFSATPEPVGVYGVIYPLATMINSVLSAFGFLFMPVISELHAGQDLSQIRRLYKVVTKWVFMATFPVILVMGFFPDRVIALTFGAKYGDGALALSVLVAGLLVNVLLGLNANTVVSFGGTKVTMYVTGAAAALNAVLNLAFIPLYGVLGAAAATAVTLLFRNLALSGYLYREARIVPLGPSLLRPGAVGGAVFLLLYYVISTYLRPTPAVLVVGLVAFVLVYGVAVLRLGGIEEEEVMLVQSFEDELGVDLTAVKRVAHRFMP